MAGSHLSVRVTRSGVRPENVHFQQVPRGHALLPQAGLVVVLGDGVG